VGDSSSAKLCPRRAGYANGRDAKESAEVRREKLAGEFSLLPNFVREKCKEGNTKSVMSMA
jgi:hypothetical protein